MQFEPGNPYQDAIPDYYRWLDEQIGSVLELLDDDTIVLVVSDHGAQRLDGGIAINEWLIREGLLVLNEYPTTLTPFEKLNVNWSKTKVWSEGGYYARVFFNVQGREPQGVIPAVRVRVFSERDESSAGSSAGRKRPATEVAGLQAQGNLSNVRNVAPDLIVHFGGLYWRSIGTVGHAKLHVQENDTGPDGCNHAQYGMFILTAPNCPLSGEYEGARLLDIAPTLLDLAGYEIPETMQGRSLVAGMEKKNAGARLGRGEDHPRSAGRVGVRVIPMSTDSIECKAECAVTRQSSHQPHLVFFFPKTPDIPLTASPAPPGAADFN